MSEELGRMGKATRGWRVGGMKVSQFTRDALAFRRQRRELERLGYEYVGDPLRTRQTIRSAERIIDAKVAYGGHGVFVKTDKRQLLGMPPFTYPDPSAPAWSPATPQTSP